MVKEIDEELDETLDVSELKNFAMSKKPMSKWAQITICILILLLCIFIGVTMIGKEEYNLNFCEERLDLKENEKAALLRDYVSSYKSKPNEEGKQEDYSYGCCRVPEGSKKVSKSQYCIHTLDYKAPTIKEEVSAFLKRFK